MTAQVRWYLEGRILRITGCITRDDFRERDRIILDFLDTGGKAPGVHLLLDNSPLTGAEYQAFLQGFREYSDEIFARTHPELRRVSSHYLLGWVISIAAPEARYLGEAIARAGQLKRRECATVAEAIEFLKSVDETLPRDLV